MQRTIVLPLAISWIQEAIMKRDGEMLSDPLGLDHHHLPESPLHNELKEEASKLCELTGYKCNPNHVPLKSFSHQKFESG